MHQIFNKQLEHIDAICDADSAYETKTQFSQTVDQTVYKSVRCRKMTPLTLGQPREKIKQDAIIESAYEKDGEEKL